MAGFQVDVARAVERLVEAINRHDTDTIVDLVTDDVSVTFAGLTPFEGKERVRSYFEWFAGYGARWDLDIVEVGSDTATCKLAAHDRWSEAAGISPLIYSRVEIAFRGSLVRRIETEFTPETNAALSAVLEAITPWATEKYPELYTEDGDYAYYLDTGARMVEVMREWKGLDGP